MILWLNRSQHDVPRVGVDADVLRADEFAAVLDIDAALVRAQDEAARIVAEARERADAIHEEALAAAQASAASAQERYIASGKLGYAAGLRRALESAHETMQYRVREEREAARRTRARLAGIVMKAVEQVVLETDRDALFERIGVTLQRLIDSESYLSLTVHPGDAARARRMLAEASTKAGWIGGFDVIADAAARDGSCVCEWDYGILVTGLDAQLAAIRRALFQNVDTAPEAGEDANVDDAAPEDGSIAAPRPGGGGVPARPGAARDVDYGNTA
ncbi:type III secretion system stator protein SctL [Robbsia sp. Bb-Pol-6]|uniref:Type 3 secretion system stator protein n=1 Tax=Robbsia betulipollinis TaxID=2981849 RepID=A0ABT3ZKK8_9BURK|nr:type III secretion system stator protein SctL [Robbsia betulipollinis]MCY0387068.1 type III secretion system stator protein SctL [Robbsia betulipollinis]